MKLIIAFIIMGIFIVSGFIASPSFMVGLLASLAIAWSTVTIINWVLDK